MTRHYTKGRIELIGYIWWPSDVLCAYSYSLTAHDIENMRGDDSRIARREVQAWIDTHSGDFSQVVDFTAEIDGASYGWSDPDSEMAYNDAYFGEEVSA